MLVDGGRLARRHVAMAPARPLGLTGRLACSSRFRPAHIDKPLTHRPLFEEPYASLRMRPQPFRGRTSKAIVGLSTLTRGPRHGVSRPEYGAATQPADNRLR